MLKLQVQLELKERMLDSYSWVLGAAGEWNATFLPAGIPIGAVKIDVQVPVVCSERSTAFPLQSGRAETG